MPECIKIRCKQCGELFEISWKQKDFRKYCSIKCSQKFDHHRYYLENKDKYKKWSEEWNKKYPGRTREYFRKWIKKNRKHHNELVYKCYRKNKKKWASRTSTYELLKANLLPMKEECKICKTKENLQTHHVIYPTKNKLIIQAVTKGKIYRLCKEHHSQHHSQLRIKNIK